MAAAAVLGKGGGASRSYLGPIRQVAERQLRAGDNVWQACRVVEALVAIDARSPEAQAMLAPMLGLLRANAARDVEDYYAWQQVKGVLALYGVAAAPLVPELRAMLGGPNFDSRAALELLQDIGPPALPELRNMLASPEESERIAAATVLEGMGRAAVGAIPDLEAAERRQPSPAIDQALDHLRQFLAR